ncbi:MAG: ComEC/Rec2 family competence protein [Bernardetiaceae bacterium]
MHWIPFPFLRYALLLMLGIGLYRWFNPLMSSILYAVMATLFLLSLFYFVKWKKRAIQLLALLLLVILGSWRAAFDDPRQDSLHLLTTSDIEAYTGRVVTEVYHKGKTWRADLSVFRVKDSTGWRPASGRVRLYIAGDTGAAPLAYGQKIIVGAAPELVRPPSNPYSFDYAAYLANQHIFHTHYLPLGSYRSLGPPVVHPLDPLAWGFSIRSYGREQLERYIEDVRSRAIASALLLGIKDQIDNDLRAAYAGAGAMHILAVSGLHVGIVFALLSWVLVRLGAADGLRIAVVVAVLWGYALVTGFSPSVVRAVLMFSLMSVAGLFGRHRLTYNSIGLSAFVLLWYDPNLLFSVSFQLSYLAVLGIVFLYPRWVRAWSPSRLWVRRAWELVVVSMAAQLATFPLAMYYFHQFPSYFLLSNLLILPAIAGILQLGIAFLVFAPIPYLGSALAWLFEWSLRWMNSVILWIEALPGAVLEGLYVSGMEVLLLYLILLAGLGFWYARRRVVGYLAVAFVLVACVWHIGQVEARYGERVLTVYDMPVANLSLRRGPWVYFWVADSSHSGIPYAVAGDQLRAYSRPLTNYPVKDFAWGKLWMWEGKKIVYLRDSRVEAATLAQIGSVDVLLLDPGLRPERVPAIAAKAVVHRELFCLSLPEEAQ